MTISIYIYVFISSLATMNCFQALIIKHFYIKKGADMSLDVYYNNIGAYLLAIFKYNSVIDKVVKL